MLTAIMGGEILRAGVNLKGKDFVYRCRDSHCPSPEMILVAGERGIRVPHFRHRANKGCKCGAGETEWHLEWKSHFDRVEVDMGVDPVTGGHNRADAVTGESLVVEFQHSPISLKEQRDRERFYTSKGGLVWVVDASGKRALSRLDRAFGTGMLSRLNNPDFPMCHKTTAPAETFPDGWADRPVGVIFDYGEGRDLVFLMPGRHNAKAVCRLLGKVECIRLLQETPSYFMSKAGTLEDEHSNQGQEGQGEDAPGNGRGLQTNRVELKLRVTERPNVYIAQDGCYWVKASNGQLYPVGRKMPSVTPYQSGYRRRRYY